MQLHAASRHGPVVVVRAHLLVANLIRRHIEKWSSSELLAVDPQWQTFLRRSFRLLASSSV
jgi:hypothetical protein